MAGERGLSGLGEVRWTMIVVLISIFPSNYDNLLIRKYVYQEFEANSKCYIKLVTESDRRVVMPTVNISK